MAPKQKKRPEKFRCDEVEGERFHAQADDVFKYNWWEVFCFPYILCSRFWDCCVSMCAGTNQCLVYWMMIQWIVCKLTRITTPDPIIFPYYFYMFCQVILLTAFFVMIWVWFGKTVFVPFFVAIWEAFTEDGTAMSHKNATRLSFRRYCFRKGEIFDGSIDATQTIAPNHSTNFIIILLDIFIINVL